MLPGVYTAKPMRGRKLIVLFAVFLQCLLGSSVFAQYSIHPEKVEAEGLTNYYIKCIAQDSLGFMWFGSEEGLFRYDGYGFQAFKNFPGEASSICNNNIELLFAENGRLWVGSRAGISCIDSKTLKVENFPADHVLTVYSLAARDDFFYVGTSSGLYQFSKTTHQWIRETSFPSNVFIRSVVAADSVHLFISSHSGLYKFNTASKVTVHYPLPVPANQKSFGPQIAHRAMIGTNGNIWFSTWSSGLLEFNKDNEKITAFLPPNVDKSLKDYRGTYDILQNDDGTIWVANSENGITVLDTIRRTTTSYPLQWDESKQLAGRAYALLKDRSGIVWIGTENGIYKNDPHSSYLSTVNFVAEKKAKRLRPDFVALCSLKDADGDWWIGSYDGLFLFDAQTGMLKNYTTKAGLTEGLSIFYMVQDNDGTIWLNNRQKLAKLQKTKANGNISFASKTFSDPRITSTIISLTIDKNKKIWLGTNHSGLFGFDPKSEHFTAFPCTDSSILVNKNDIRFIYELPGGSLLLGGEQLGLIQYYPGQNRFMHALLFASMKDGNTVTTDAIVKDVKGNLWIGTEGYGLVQTDEQLKQYRQFTTRDGFPSMNISAMAAGSNDHLWLLTEGGAVDYCTQRKKMVLFDKHAGIRNFYNLSFILNVGHGAIAMGDMGCVHMYNPLQNSKPLTPPEVMIASFKIFDKSYPFTPGDTVQLNYNQNYFSFDYLALDYTKPSHNSYAYMLEGVDNKWNDAGSRRYASYTNLDEGNYTFKVKACNSAGIWNENPATLHLIIKPPFWHRWWFYSLVVLTAVLLLYLAYFIKNRQLNIREQLRNKIARDLHDDIGSTLSGINIFSKLALQKLPYDQKASSELLQRINSRTEKTMEALSDIVWSINTRKDNMEHVLARMREYVGEVIEPLGIGYELSDGGIANVHIDMEIRKEVYLIFKEALHNVSKYAGCTFISITLKRQDKSILLCIEDNGKGFDSKYIVAGNGIYNMQERAEKIGAAFEITSQINAGTKIRLLFPIT